MGLVQLGVVQMRVVQMCTFTFLNASKVIIDFQFFNNNVLSPQTLLSFWYRINYVIKKTKGVVGRGLGWHELGMDPNW